MSHVATTAVTAGIACAVLFIDLHTAGSAQTQHAGTARGAFGSLLQLLCGL